MYSWLRRALVFDSMAGRPQIIMDKYPNTVPSNLERNDIADIPPEFLLSTYSYDLPPELIAHSPAEHRDQSKLLLIDRNTGELQHRLFFELPSLLTDGDVVVINETQVITASLKGKKTT